MANSILPPEMRGVMFISGYRGVGKTFLAAQADIPSNVAFFDFEEKGSSLNAQLHFGLYRPLTQEVAELMGSDAGPGSLFPAITSAFSGLEKDRYTVAVLDNIKPLEDAARWAVEQNPQRYGLNVGNVRSGRFGGAWPGVHYIVSNLCDVLQSRGVQLIIATSHVRSRWGGGGPIPGKYNIRGVDRWQELSILTLILFQAEHSPIPSALVQKEQLGSIQYDESLQEFVIKRRLPLRLPQATFAQIKHYLRTPADLRNPSEGEVPSKEEIDPFDEKLSREQLAYIMAGMTADEQLEEVERQYRERVSEQEETSLKGALLRHPTTWQELLEMTGKNLGDLGGLGEARGMSEEEIGEKWEEWRKEET